MNLRPLAFVSVLPLLGGCEAFRNMLPSVAFDRLDLRSINWNGVETDFIFAIDNPSPIEMKIARFDYTLKMNGHQWVSGQSISALQMSAVDQSEMVLPVNIGFQELYEVIGSDEGRDTVPYGISGSIGFDTPSGVVDLPFDHQGSFPALRTPTIRPTAVRVDDLYLLGGEVDLTVEMEADNQHESTLYFEDFRYKIMMSDTEVIGGFMDELGSVDGTQTETFELPIQLDLLDLGSVVYGALVTGDGEVDVGLDVSANVVTPFGTIPFAGVQNADVSVR